MKLIVFSVFLIWLLQLGLFAETIEFEGTVSKKDGDILTIQFESDWAPNVGDPVTISTTIAGRVLKGGEAEVTEVGDGTVKAKVLDGKPNIRMKAVIVSENPVPVNLSPEATYEAAMKLFRQAFANEEEVFAWNLGDAYDTEAYKAAIPIMKKAAELGHPDALYVYARHHHKETVTSDLLLSDRKPPENHWLREAADAGHIEASFILGMAYRHGFTIGSDEEKSKAYLKQAADKGHAEAAFELAYDIKDLDEALAYRTKSAEGGFIKAQLNLGRHHKNIPTGQQFAPYDLNKAVYWFERAAEQDSAEALVELGDLYFNGGTIYPIHEDSKRQMLKAGVNPSDVNRQYDSRKIPKDLSKAHDYYTRAANLESSSIEDPFERLGRLHSQRKTDYYDETKATDWYLKGAENRKLKSTIQLARRYRLGIGTGADPADAFAWLNNALKTWPGSAELKIELALCHSEGIGTPVDAAKAVELLKEVSMHESLPSHLGMIYLGDLYREGKGVRQDQFSAFSWYSKALEIKPSVFIDQENEITRAMAYARLARAHAYGEGVTQQMNLVFEFSSSALRLDPYQPLALRCGGLFLNSFREKENKQKAAKAFERAAGLGDIESYYLLGEMYAKGSGVTRSKESAISHYQIAARAGHEKAQNALRKLKVDW